MKRQVLTLAVALIVHAGAAAAVTEIRFWHSMSGALEAGVIDLASRFNASQRDFRVVPVFKGGYEESMATGLAAQPRGNGPHLIEVVETGTAAMMASKKTFKPVHQVMLEAGEKFDPRAYLPAVSGYYSDNHGKLLSLPFNSSTPVFYFNKDAFRAAGLDPDKAPRTWREVQAAALALQESESTPCAYTTGWQSWVLVENLSAWHNEPFATRSNGYGGAGSRLEFNAELLVRHISLMSSWVKSGLFTYAGRAGEGDAKFASGECAMVTTSSSAYPSIESTARFEFAVSPLPYYDEFNGAPYNTIVGGASLWVLTGKKPSEYKGVARFLSFLSRADIPAEWYQRTGYLPITWAGYELTRKQGHYDRHPGTEIPVQQLNQRTHVHSRGLRLGNLARIRGVIDEELEAVWSRRKTPKEALDAAVERGNELLRSFERAGRR